MVPTSKIRMMDSTWFNPTVPPRRQRDRWACGPSALGWALDSLGLNVAHDYIVAGMVGPGYLVPVDGFGMRDKTGVDMAEYINHDFAFMGVEATAYPHVEWHAVTAEAGRWPLILYGEGWGHWTAVRGLRIPGGYLMLANGADPLRAEPRQELTRDDFATLGPFHMVTVRRR